MQTLEDKVRQIQLVVFDVDGVLTDGRLYYSEQGDEFKAFHVRDGLGIKQLLAHRIEVAIISGRYARSVEKRMAELGVKHVYQEQEDKLSTFHALLKKLQLAPEQAAFVGDDLPDLTPMQHAGLGIAVADACPEIIKQADHQTLLPGGCGAVREICDWLLKIKFKT